MCPAPATSNPSKPGRAADGGYQLFCDFARCFAERSCQLEGDGQGIVSHLHLWRFLDGEARNFYLELFQQDGVKTLK